MDVKWFYHNAPVDCNLYVKQPLCYKMYDKCSKEFVWKLMKSAYCLEQSGRNSNIYIAW